MFHAPPEEPGSRGCGNTSKVDFGSTIDCRNSLFISQRQRLGQTLIGNSLLSQPRPDSHQPATSKTGPVHIKISLMYEVLN
jgi:hypothetical protein